MGTPIFTEDHLAMLNTTASRVSSLEHHRDECDRLHEVGKEHRKRSDDAMNHLTDSNILLAKTITDMNITMTKIADKVEAGQPVINFWTMAGTAWTFNRIIGASIVSLVVGVAAIVGLWKMLG